MSAGARSAPRQVARAFAASPTGIVALVAVGAIVALALVGPGGFGPQATTVDVAHANQGASAAHLLGTDNLGRDILARTLAATRTSVALAALAMALAVGAGTAIGLAVAASPPRLRRVGETAIDTMMSFGDILLAVVVVAIVGVGATGAVIAVGIAFAPAFARFTYSLARSVIARDYVAAARVTGVRGRRLLARYVLRNVVDPLTIAAFTALGDCVIALSSLSFLGLGVQSPTFDWGQMLIDGVRSFYLNPWAALAPAALIAFTGVAFGLFGDAVARAANPLLWHDRPRLLRRRGASAPPAGRVDSAVSR